MKIPVILIILFTTYIHCKENHGDHILFVQGGQGFAVSVSGPYLKAEVGDRRREYKNKNNDTIEFRDNMWVLTREGIILFENAQESLIPPKHGWTDIIFGRNLIVVYKVPVTTPPPVLFVKDNSIPDIGGVYNFQALNFTLLTLHYNMMEVL